MVSSAIIDEEGPLLHLMFLAGQPAPLRLHEWCLAVQVLGIEAGSLPIIWDADFLYGPRATSGEDPYVLCEINASSCFALPEQAPATIVRLTLARLCSARQQKR
jgi:uncharacterized protein DUF6815